MSKICSRCSEKKGKGKHYVTCSVTGGTIRWDLRTCFDCGEELSKEITNTVNRWLFKKEAKK